MLQYSESCERNKAPILKILSIAFKDKKTVLEIGSGTGQHAVYFAKQLPHLIWQTSDLSVNIPTIQARLQQEGPKNVHHPVELDVSHQPWPIAAVDGVFSANTLHIMSWRHVEKFFSGAATVLHPGGYLCVYGPFKYNNHFTSQSNAQFDVWLKQRDPLSGVRDFEALNKLAKTAGLMLHADHVMPAYNQLLVWQMLAK